MYRSLKFPQRAQIGALAVMFAFLTLSIGPAAMARPAHLPPVKEGARSYLATVSEGHPCLRPYGPRHHRAYRKCGDRQGQVIVAN